MEIENGEWKLKQCHWIGYKDTAPTERRILNFRIAASPTARNPR